MEQQDIIRSFEQALYTCDELDRAVLTAIRELMIANDLWENFHEGTFEEIVNPGGVLFIDPHGIESDFLWEDREEVNAFIRGLSDILFQNCSISLYEDGEAGMTYLYRYVDDRECNCTNPYCAV